MRWVDHLIRSDVLLPYTCRALKVQSKLVRLGGGGVVYALLKQLI